MKNGTEGRGEEEGERERMGRQESFCRACRTGTRNVKSLVSRLTTGRPSVSIHHHLNPEPYLLKFKFKNKSTVTWPPTLIEKYGLGWREPWIPTGQKCMWNPSSWREGEFGVHLCFYLYHTPNSSSSVAFHVHASVQNIWRGQSMETKCKSSFNELKCRGESY